MSRFYLTTPIYYVNDKPHIGHATTTIAADALARFYRLSDTEVVFLTGTDENSQKTVEAAEKAGEEPAVYTDRLAAIWKSTWEKLGISFTDFIRTTEERHKKTVLEIWKRIAEKGDIYKGRYEGLYCTGCEAFKKESDLVDGLCPDHKRKPETISEENYFFKLSKYQSELLQLYDSNPDFVVPAHRFQEVKSFVAAGLEDISISREGKSWGIPVPGDPKHIIYVWFDALINYVSGVGIENWGKQPADVHFVGKDILRFHAVIWPAMLLAAGLPLPKRIGANGFLTINGEKISKSLGNAIDPLALIEKYGTDALRYFLLREVPYGDDGDFSEEKFVTRYNADLANGIGNFAARVLALAEKRGEIITDYNKDHETEVARIIAKTQEAIHSSVKRLEFHHALVEISKLVAFGDEYVNREKPWALPVEGEEYRFVLANLLFILENAAYLYEAFLPNASAAIKKALGRNNSTYSPKKLAAPLFPRK